MYRRGGRRLTVNALHKCSHVPVELLRGLHKGNKAALVLAMFRERIAVALPPPSVGTAEEAIRDAARALIGPLNVG